jgi:hypothetical protein
VHQDEEDEEVLEIEGGTMQVVISLTNQKHETGKSIFMVEEQWVSEQGEMHPLRTLYLAASNREEIEDLYVQTIQEVNPDAEIIRDVQVHANAGEEIN